MIVKYIRELLKDHDRVIIPNFGAFLKSKGEIKKIIFNEFIKFNDGQLINLISEKEGFPVSDASKRVDDFAEKIKNELSEKEKTEFEGIGYLYKDENGRTRFMDYEQETIEADELAGGATAAEKESEPAADTDQEEEQTKEKTAAPASDNTDGQEEKPETEKKAEAPDEQEKEEEPAPQQVKEEKTAPPEKAEVKSKPEPKTEQPKDVGTKPDPEKISQQDPRMKQDEHDRPGRKKMIIWLLVIFIPLIAIGAYVIIDYQNIKNFLTSEKVEPDETLDRDLVPVQDMEQAEVMPEESEPAAQPEEQPTEEQQMPEQMTPAEQPASQEKSEQQMQQSEQTKESQPQETQYVPPKKYHLIAGVFTNKQNAEKKLKQLKEEGFYAEIVGRINDKYYVSYNSFKEKQDAAYEKDRLIEKGYETWIYYY